MRITKKAIAAVAALALAGGGGVLMMTSADAATTTPTADVVPGDNTVTSRTVKDDSLYQSDFNQDVINKVFRVPGYQSVTAWSVKPGSISEASLSQAVVDKLNKPGTGVDGKDGVDGTNGTNGTDGKDGVSGLAIDGPTKVIPTGFSEITLDCAAGKKAIGGGVKFDSGTSATAKDLVVNGSYPAKLAEVNGVSTSTAWTVAVTNNNNAQGAITVQTFVTCIIG
jgi:hypothetical protein